MHALAARHGKGSGAGIHDNQINIALLIIIQINIAHDPHRLYWWKQSMPCLDTLVDLHNYNSVWSSHAAVTC